MVASLLLEYLWKTFKSNVSVSKEMELNGQNNETPTGYKHLGKGSSSLVIKEIQTEVQTFYLISNTLYKGD